MNFKRLISALAVGAAFAAPAMAIPINVQFNIAALGSFTANTGDVTTATTITNGSPDLVGAIQANNISLVSGTLVTLLPDPLGVSVGSTFTKTFTTAFGTFQEVLTVTSSTPTANALGVLATGTISEIAYTSGPVFDPTTVFWSAAYTQNGGPGAQVNGSFNDSTTPPHQTPEPASLALVGMALAGAALARRRRQA